MKRIRIILVWTILLLVLASCSSNSDVFHYDLIKEYATADKYYKNTYKDAKIESFGTKYGAKIYDVEAYDGELRYYYAYDGKAANEQGRKDITDYLKYLEENFEKADQSGIYAYKVDDENFIKVTEYRLSNESGRMILVIIPSNVEASSDVTDSVHFDYISASADAEG